MTRRAGEAGLAPTENFVVHLAGHPRITDPENIIDDRRGEACLAHHYRAATLLS